MTANAEHAVALMRSAHPRDGYLAYHAPRYQRLLSLVAGVVRPGSRLLDIGRSRFTDLLASTLGLPVDSLGFGSDGTTATGRHFALDLNATEDHRTWRADVDPYDCIVMAEVIEHLHVSPVHVLGFLRTILRPGGVLIVQTPNAAALHKRLKLLAGRNPYELIREDSTDPGHFREYTRAELARYLEAQGYAIERFSGGAYFDYRFIRHGHDRLEQRDYLAAVNWLYRLLPAALQPGMTVVARVRP